tara:strand:- start:399 stop:614 length:216 start_codon:yes stop_codon:yes gene_type:complete
MLEFILASIYLYMGIGMCFAVGHCLILILALSTNIESAEEITFMEMIQQVFSWIMEWPIIIQQLLASRFDK